MKSYLFTFFYDYWLVIFAFIMSISFFVYLHDKKNNIKECENDNFILNKDLIGWRIQSVILIIIFLIVIIGYVK